MNSSISIAGSGPAGLTAAIALARAGFPVTVYERNREAGQRFLGDVQGMENWSDKRDVLEELRAFQIDVNFDCHPLNTLLVSNGDEMVRLPSFSRPLAYLVKRGAVEGSLDRKLKEQALRAGVRIHYGTNLNPEHADIVATGPRMNNLVAIAKGVLFTTHHENTACGLAQNDAAYKGYAYLLIADGYGCICTVLFDRFSTLNTAFATTRDMFSRLLPVDMRDEKPIGGVGSFLLHPQWTRGNQKFVGEAAGLQDLLWGFGIRSAMRSGWLAATSIIENQPFAKLANAHYGRYEKAGLVNRYLWEHFGYKNYGTVLRRLKATSDPACILRSFYNYNILQRLIYPIAYVGLRKRYR